MNLLNLATIAGAASGVSGLLKLNGAPRNLTAQGKFLYGSGGATVDAWLQTTLDGGLTWIDIANWHFTTAVGTTIYNLAVTTALSITPTDGALAANTVVDGVLGPQFRVKWATTGTYAGATSLAIDVSTDQLGN